MEINRENRWVRVWQTEGAVYVDSKYRCYECDATADDFLEAWKAGDSLEREDLAQAFEYFPYEEASQKILAVIKADNILLGEQMQVLRDRTFHGEGRPETDQFLKEYHRFFSGTRKRLVWKAKKFQVEHDESGFWLEDRPGEYIIDREAEYKEEIQKANSRLEEDAIGAYFGFWKVRP